VKRHDGEEGGTKLLSGQGIGVVQFGRIDAGRTLALLRPAGAKSAVFRGVVGGKVRTLTYNIGLGAGPFNAVLRFTGGRRLTLSTPLGRVAGASPLQLNGTSTTGTFTLRVTGTGAKTSFVLTLTYVA